MFQIVVDTDTPPATPNYFADLEKTVPAPSVIPLVQGFRGKVRVYFVGEHVPAETAGLALYVRPMNQKGKAVETAVAPQQSDDDGNVFYDIDLVADTTALEVAIGARENVVMRGGLVAYDASVNPPTQIEWQMDLGVSASALGYGQTPPILPNAIEEHNLNESSHPFLLEKIRVLETEVSENNSELKTEISELAGTVASNYSELKTEISELAETVATEISEITSELSVLEQTVSTNNSELKTEISEVASELSALETELSENYSELKTEVSELAGTVACNYSELKTEISELAGTVACNYSELKTEISEVDSEVGIIKSNYVTTDTAQEITGLKTFKNTAVGNFPLILCSVSSGFIGFSSSSTANPQITIATGVGTSSAKYTGLLVPLCGFGTFALTKNITTCTTAVKSELQSELDAISGDLDCFGRLSATNTWTKPQVFKMWAHFCGGAHLDSLSLPLGNSQIYLNEGQYTIAVPNKSGTLALTSDFPAVKSELLSEISNSFATLSGNNDFNGSNTFFGANTFAGDNKFRTGVLFCQEIGFDGGGCIFLCDYNYRLELPKATGMLALTSDLPDTSAFATLTGNNSFTGTNTFRNTTFSNWVCFNSDIGFRTQGLLYTCDSHHQILFPKASGTLALTSDLPDLCGFVTLAGNNTFTGINTFAGCNAFLGGLYAAGAGIKTAGSITFCTRNPVISANGNYYYFPNKCGTFALTSDIPDTSGFATLAGGNTFSGDNSFSGYISFYNDIWVNANVGIVGDLAFCTANPSIGVQGNNFYFPATGGTLVVDSQLASLRSNIPAICKTTVANYENITPTAGTLYFLTNS